MTEKIKFEILLWSMLCITAFSCQFSEAHTDSFDHEIQIDTLEIMIEGEPLIMYTLKNSSGMQVEVLNFGGIITRLTAIDRNGKWKDIVLGFDDVALYFDRHPYFGAIVGRYGNRIAKGKFSIQEKEYSLATNNGVNHLHGGLRGFDKVIWSVKPLPDVNGLELTYLSKDGEEGYPGNLEVQVTYILTDEDALEIEYKANTDQPTIVNLTQHSYFNLSEEADVLNHSVSINADQYLPVDETLIPTGEIQSVNGSPFDFTKMKKVGKDIGRKDHEQILLGGGYDHCWVLNKEEELSLAAVVIDEKSGRRMEVFTTEPGVQFYTGNFLSSNVKGKNNVAYQKHSGLCLETQHFPDSPNQPEFPSVLLEPNNSYFSKTIYSFSVK